jgi:glycine/D-amino acid oxidase-like deaminating enzyme
LPPDWERMGPFLEKAMSRVPATMTTGMKHFFCGPESFTPDLSPILGEAPELRNYFVAAVSESAEPACRMCPQPAALATPGKDL